MPNLKFLSAGLLTIVLMTGCQAMTGKTAGENVDDATISTSVKARLAADKIGNLTRVDVDTNRGVVSLNGVVQSAEHKARAEEVARRAGGVRDVINNLQIQSQPPASAAR